MLERSIASTLGLSVSVSDRDIDVDLPADVSEDIENENDLSVALLSTHAASATSAVIHIFRLSQLESRIYSSMYRIDCVPVTHLAQKIARFRELLNDWKLQIPLAVPYVPTRESTSPNSYVDRRYHFLHYHPVMLLLLLPSLAGMESTQPDFQLYVTSAGQVAQLYKQLHDHQNMLSYSLIALHATFVAGLTLIHCFLVSERSIFSPEFSSDVRACTTVLYVISGRWTAARKVRDASERMVGLTVERSQRRDMSDIDESQVMEPHLRDAPGEQTPTDMLWAELAARMPGPQASKTVPFSEQCSQSQTTFGIVLGHGLGTKPMVLPKAGWS